MRELKKEEMFNIDGGGNSLIIGSVIGIILTFVVGVLHGYANPKSCNE